MKLLYNHVDNIPSGWQWNNPLPTVSTALGPKLGGRERNVQFPLVLGLAMAAMVASSDGCPIQDTALQRESWIANFLNNIETNILIKLINCWTTNSQYIIMWFFLFDTYSTSNVISGVEFCRTQGLANPQSAVILHGVADKIQVIFLGESKIEQHGKT